MAKRKVINVKLDFYFEKSEKTISCINSSSKAKIHKLFMYLVLNWIFQTISNQINSYSIFCLYSLLIFFYSDSTRRQRLLIASKKTSHSHSASWIVTHIYKLILFTSIVYACTRFWWHSRYNYHYRLRNNHTIPNRW